MLAIDLIDSLPTYLTVSCELICIACSK